MKIVNLLVISLLFSGCAGLGLNKKATMMPDEIWIQNEIDPSDNGKVQEIKVVGGAKWKLQ
jgi:hypothetical protein